MILKLSVREFRELLSSGSVPQGGVLGAVTRPVGDGKTRLNMTTPGGGPCYVGADGSDYDVDKVGRYCSRPVYADVPPMPEGYLDGFPRDCTAAMFGRRFTGAFDAWLDAFDCVLRSLPGGDRGRRMLDMESYAVTDTDAVVRVYRLEGGLRKGGPFHGHRVHLKPLSVLGSGCGDYVDVVVSNEVDALVRGLGDELGFDGSQMATVRALVALEERPPLHDEAHDVTGGNADEGMAGTADVTDAGGDDGVKKRLEKLRSALWENLNMMSDSINHQLERNDNGMQVVVNTVTGSTAVIVYVQVRNGKEDWTRGKCWTVDLSQVEGEDYDAVADTVVPEWSSEVFRAVMRGDWGGWRGSSMACRREMCGRTEAATEDYEQLDREAEKEKEKEDKVGRLDAALWERLRVMADSVNGLLSLVGRTRQFVVNTIPVRESGKVLVIVHVQDAVADTVRSRDYEVGVGALGACGFGTYVERVVAGWAGTVVKALFCDEWGGWRERRSDGTLVMCGSVAEAGANDYDEMRVPAPGPDFGSRNADVQDYDIDDDRHVEGVGEDGGDEVGKTVDDEAGNTRKAVKIVRGQKSEYDAAAHAGCVYYAADKEEITVNGETYGCKAFVSRREVMAHKAAVMIREWMDGLDRWAEAMHKERGGAHGYGMNFSVFPSGGGIRLMCHDMDHSFGKAIEYAVYDRWCPLPDGVDADATDFAVMMCAMMAGDLSDHEQWMDIDGFLRREGSTPFDARVLEALGGQDEDEDEDEDE